MPDSSRYAPLRREAGIMKTTRRGAWMRSVDPIPGNPWPHEMTITVEDSPSALLELLWIRGAHGLDFDSEDFPPLLADPPAAANGSGPSASVRAGWERAWSRLWRAAAQHAGQDQDPVQFERLHQTANGSPERLQILQELFGPSWRDEFGDAAFDDPSFRGWSERGSDKHMSSMSRPLAESPEHRDLDAVIRAWRNGLTRVVTIPCRGEFSRKITDNALLVTDATRADSSAYQRALDSFD